MAKPVRQRRARKPPRQLTPQHQNWIRSLLIYEDSALLAFNKPSGLAVQGGSGIAIDFDFLLGAFANRKGHRPKLVHRLDRETSGLLIVAKTSPAAAHLSAQFASRSLSKRYLALVAGEVAETRGEIALPLVKINSGGLDLMRPARENDQDPQAARTDYRVLAKSVAASLIEAAPHTGRMHQIRVHMAAFGHAILGDTKYGGLMVAGGKPCPRLMLHAFALDFTHPDTGAPMHLSVAPPSDLIEMAQHLGLDLEQGLVQSLSKLA
ncbi:RluA family pseudouridine synthase [Candidatus Phycosocius spiralis]|uniref:RluA family pseudouridine synthase n=1 Tax=Candidatus Phycosocius spiralis TaxID=2815099 RepID=UPI0024E0921F|nr:RluA family pseudouridine synthase [Candidatus Phycosocius spiralis]